MEVGVNNQLKYPVSNQIEPEQARFLFEKHCAILIVEDLPLGSEFGIDMTAYRIGEKFKGVKLIPPGIHFVYASATDKSNYQCGPRCGFFYNFKVKEILIKKWSTLKEDFDDSFCPTEKQRDRYQTNLRELDRYLGAYMFSTYQTYLHLTNKMTVDIVQSLMPDCNRIRSVPYLTKDTSLNVNERKVTRRNMSSKHAEDSLLPDLKPDKTTRIHFTKLHSDQEISHNMITKYNLDTTMKLNHTFCGQTGRQQLLAEFQFAFTTFILCHVYECFEQWKQILGLICLAETGLTSFPSFYLDFIQIMRHQMDQMPEDLFDEIVDSNNLVRCRLDTFFLNIQDCPNANNNLMQCALELKKDVEGKFGWLFELEKEDEQPVIVEI